MVVAVTLAVLGIATWLAPVRWVATATVLVPGAIATAVDGEASVLATQADIVTSQRVALMVVDALRLHERPERIAQWRRQADGAGSIRHHLSDALRANLRVDGRRESGVLAITVSADDPREAARLADAFADAYVALGASLGVGSGRGAVRGPAPLDAAVVPDRPDRPGIAARPGLVAGAGLVLAALAVAWAERRDRRVRDPGTLAGTAGLPMPIVVRDAFRARRRPRADDPARSGGAGRRPSAPHVETRTFAPARAVSPDAEHAPFPATATFADGAGMAPPYTTATHTDDAKARTDAVRMRTDAATAHADDLTAHAETNDSHAANGTSHAATVTPHSDAATAHAAPAAAAAATRPAVRPPIGRILVDAGLIQPPEVERVLAWARAEGTRFGEAAVSHRLLTAEQLERALAHQYAFSILARADSAVSDEVVAAFDPSNPAVADLRRLRTRIRLAQQEAGAGGGPRSVAVLSAGAGEGKSFVAANLAVVCAQAGLRTLLVDADLRRGRLHGMFGLDGGAGLSTLLDGRMPAGAIRRVPGLPDLCVLPCGPAAPNPSELLSRDAMLRLHRALARTWDLVVFDSAGVPQEPDAAVVAHAADAAIVVVRRGRSAVDEVDGLMASDAVRGVRILATVFDEG